jgi:hypothetical protein
VFTPTKGGPPEPYLGRIDEFGVALGAVNQGHLVWGVIAPSTGVPRGALSGTYSGVGASEPVREHIDSSESLVIQGRRADSLGVADVDEQESRTL